MEEELIACETCKFTTGTACILDHQYKIDVLKECLTGTMRVKGLRKNAREKYNYSLWQTNKEDFLTEEDMTI